MCQTDYVCTAWVRGFGRCGRAASWTGKLFRCEQHAKDIDRARRRRARQAAQPAIEDQE